jgi:hypothetical protein
MALFRAFFTIDSSMTIHLGTSFRERNIDCPPSSVIFDIYIENKFSI